MPLFRSAGRSDLHGDNNKIGKETAFNEKGEAVKVTGDTPLMHDILTGSDKDGHAFPANMDLTCGNWTSSGLVPPCSDTLIARDFLQWPCGGLYGVRSFLECGLHVPRLLPARPNRHRL
jgi:hypothetical protein